MSRPRRTAPAGELTGRGQRAISAPGAEAREAARTGDAAGTGAAARSGAGHSSGEAAQSGAAQSSGEAGQRTAEAQTGAVGAEADETASYAGPGQDDATAPGRLFVVATPIGNLSDLSLRAIQVLRSVALIAAEDTRLTRRLLERHGIETRMRSFHARSGPRRLEELLERLRSGDDVAIVTDAGTPGVSDPGESLVSAWAREDGTVVPIPGASAVLAAVSASGVAGPRWAFEGFLPRSGRDRRERLERIARDVRGTVLYEAPGRVATTLADLATTCGVDRPAAVCRELTKVHEEIVRGSLGYLADRARAGELMLRGEFAIVVGSLEAGSGLLPAAPDGLDLASARAEVARRAASGLTRSEAARRVAAETGLPRRELYAEAPSGSPASK